MLKPIEDGTAWAYSLRTNARFNLLLSDAANHVKRIEVVRPRGNAVVFDFAWNTTTQTFDPIGVPAGTNDRDAKRLYVLRDITPGDDGDRAFELRFQSGIVHEFAGDEGTLLHVRDDVSGLESDYLGVGYLQIDPIPEGLPPPPARTQYAKVRV